MFLTYNGYNFQRPGILEMVEYVVAIAKNEKTLQQVTTWLKSNSRPLS